MMSPLASENEDNIIRWIGGLPEVKKQLEDLGFAVGDNVRVIMQLDGTLRLHGGAAGHGARCHVPENPAWRLKREIVNASGNSEN